MSASPQPARVPTARDIMVTELITLDPDASYFDAIRTFVRHRISGAPVVDRTGALVGTCSELDCLRVMASGQYYRDDHQEEGTVRSMMRTDFEFVAPHVDIYAIAHQFVKHNVRRLPVLEDGRLVGQLSRRDVLRAMEAFANSRMPRRRYPDYPAPSASVGARRRA